MFHFHGPEVVVFNITTVVKININMSFVTHDNRSLYLGNTLTVSLYPEWNNKTQDFS